MGYENGFLLTLDDGAGENLVIRAASRAQRGRTSVSGFRVSG